MKQTRNAITMLKSAYQSVYFKGLVLGAATYCLAPAAANAYTYTEVIEHTPTSHIEETKELPESNANLYLSSETSTGEIKTSWLSLTGAAFGSTEEANKGYLALWYGFFPESLYTLYVHNGDSYNEHSVLNLKLLTTTGNRVVFNDNLLVNTDKLEFNANLDATKTSMRVKKSFANAEQFFHTPNEPYETLVARFGSLVLDGADINVTKGKVIADDLSVISGAHGSIVSVETNKLTVGTEANGGAKLFVKNLKADKIKVDPAWDSPTAILAVENFEGSDGTVANSDISVGQNSAFVFGASSLANAESLVNGAGGVTQTGIKAMMYVNKPMSIGALKGITVDGNELSPETNTNTLTIGANSAVVLGQNVVSSSLIKADNSQKAAITFKNAGTVNYVDSSRVLLDSSNIKVGSRFKIFDNATVTNTSGSGNNLTVESVNGNFKTYIAHTDTTGVTATDPVSGVPGDNGGAGSNTGNSGVTAPIEQTFTQLDYSQLSNALYQVLQGSLANIQSIGTGVSYLSTVAGETFTGGSEIELAAKHPIYSGLYQTSFEVANLVDNAVQKRVALDTSANRLFGFWATPYYEHYSASGLDSGDTKYGIKSKLSGLIIGTDLAVNDQMRLGLLAHFGNASTDGKDVGKNTDGKNKYWGLGVYASGLTSDIFSIDGEVSYTHVDNKADSSLGLISYQNLNTKTKGNMFRTAVNTTLIFDFGDYRVMPYAGVKYTQLKLDKSQVYANNVNVAQINSHDMNVVSIPLGVKADMSVKAGDWTLLPTAKAGINFNLGDTDAEFKTTFIGANSSKLKGEVLNRFTYDLGLGLTVNHSSGLELTLGGAYVGSKDSNAYSVALEGAYKF